jgi:calcineurin-like phosphoesterase family protein
MKIKLKENDNRKIWVTSDTHYGHANICRGVTKWRTPDGSIPIDETRDFGTIEEMNDAIVNNINSVVGQDDILIHLGDWSFGGFENIEIFRKRIICEEIHLVLGNHDHHIENNRDGIRSLFTSVNHYLFLSVTQPTNGKHITHRFVLCHYPIASWNGMGDGVIHLHGHVHLPKKYRVAKGRAMDVGVDGNDLKPNSLENVITILENRPKCVLTLLKDHHEK